MFPEILVVASEGSSQGKSQTPDSKWPSSIFLSHFSVLWKKIDIHMKPGLFKTLELTAEFGTKLVNFLCQLHKVNFTFHLYKLSAKGKGNFSSLKNFYFFKN